jgi:DNA-binding SARP family transcriptional activator
MHPGVEHPWETMVGLLWPERTDFRALRGLHTALSRLRDTIGEWLLAFAQAHGSKRMLYV